MKYRVIDSRIYKDITDEYDWVITPEGKLFFLDGGSLTGYEDAFYALELDCERLCVQ